jgi:CheY-like chemotaxis protein
MFDFFKRKKSWPAVQYDEIQKRTKILVIDDSDFVYLPLFKKDGYNIEKWDDVKDLPKLESGNFDIILLDIQGVGKEQSKDEGFGILRHLRKVNPAQIIVAYSNADWSLKYQDFFREADATLAKSSDYVEFKRTVDRLLNDRFSIGFYINRVVALAGSQVSDNSKLRQLTEDAILDRSTIKLESFLKANTEKIEIITATLKIAGAASSLLKAFGPQ